MYHGLDRQPSRNGRPPGRAKLPRNSLFYGVNLALVSARIDVYGEPQPDEVIRL